MFDITSSKLLLLAIVALLVIGPKDFPALLRTIGKYVGIIRGHAREFRAQFDEAMRESELSQLKQDVEKIAQETETSFRDSTQSVEQSLDEARQGIDSSFDTVTKPPPEPLPKDTNGPSAAPSELPRPEETETATALNGSSHDSASERRETSGYSDAPGRPAEKSGA
jgi:sec-independent protein translocase protein TatB